MHGANTGFDWLLIGLVSGKSSLKKGRYWIKKQPESEPIVSEEPQRTEPLSQFEAEILSNIFDKNKK